jgi:hypothetical protein
MGSKKSGMGAHGLFIRLGIGTDGWICEYGNEPLASIKCGKFLDWLRAYYVFRNDPSPWNYFYIHIYVKHTILTIL